MNEVDAGHEFTKVQLAELESLRRQVADLKAYGETRADEMLAATNLIAEQKETIEKNSRAAIEYRSDIERRDGYIDEQSALIEKLHSALERHQLLTGPFAKTNEALAAYQQYLEGK